MVPPNGSADVKGFSVPPEIRCAGRSRAAARINFYVSFYNLSSTF
jgi:hypothetical protein